jgi:hypothetical protein
VHSFSTDKNDQASLSKKGKLKFNVKAADTTNSAPKTLRAFAGLCQQMHVHVSKSYHCYMTPHPKPHEKKQIFSEQQWYDMVLFRIDRIAYEKKIAGEWKERWERLNQFSNNYQPEQFTNRTNVNDSHVENQLVGMERFKSTRCNSRNEPSKARISSIL